MFSPETSARCRRCLKRHPAQKSQSRGRHAASSRWRQTESSREESPTLHETAPACRPFCSWGEPAPTPRGVVSQWPEKDAHRRS